jgi:hypothetical protein
MPAESGACKERSCRPGGNINLMTADTSTAETAFREALRRDPANQEAKGRLQAIGKQP